MLHYPEIRAPVIELDTEIGQRLPLGGAKGRGLVGRGQKMALAFVFPTKVS